MRERKGRAGFGEVIRSECPRVILEVVSSRHENYLVWSLEDAGGGKAGGGRGLSSWEEGSQRKRPGTEFWVGAHLKMASGGGGRTKKRPVGGLLKVDVSVHISAAEREHVTGRESEWSSSMEQY